MSDSSVNSYNLSTISDYDLYLDSDEKKRLSDANIKWKNLSKKCYRDLSIKKICLLVSGALNLALLGSIASVFILYHPIPETAFIISPFIIGVLGALAYMGTPLFGVNRNTYTDYSNPTHLAGKAITYLFFAPYVFTVKKTDDTCYHHARVAQEISLHLEKKDFDFIASNYGSRLSNLNKYGFISDSNAEKIKNLYTKYTISKKNLEHLNKNRGNETSKNRIKKKLAIYNSDWKTIQKSLIAEGLPRPEVSTPDYSKKCTQMALLWERLISARWSNHFGTFAPSNKAP